MSLEGEKSTRSDRLYHSQEELHKPASDLQADESTAHVTEHAPTWLPTIPKLRIDTAHQSLDPMRLPLGQLYGDFFIRRELGRGAFGVVYLAEQMTLRRTVALKVTDFTRNDGCQTEGQTIAQLEHPSIVKVYSQSTDDEKKRRLLCMQYISGVDLRKLMNVTHQKFGDHWSGKNLLNLLNEEMACKENVCEENTLGENSLQDQSFMQQADKLAAICWIGSEAALALDHAHRAGYVHRDVKPENTIVNRVGRPMLVDFNLAMTSDPTAAQGVVGGTIHYMSPETIEDFAAYRQTKPEAAISADTYALGIMLWEFTTGQLPFRKVAIEKLDNEQGLKEMLRTRDATPTHPDIDPTLAICLGRAIQFDPETRYPSAGSFAEELRGVAHQARALKARDSNGWLAKSIVAHPTIWMIIATFLPHVVASALQIAYNQAEIVSQLLPQANELFDYLLFTVNPITYGVGAILGLRKLFQVMEPWYAMQTNQQLPAEKVEHCRRQLLLLPRFFAILGSLGWISGAVVFPGIICLLAQNFSSTVWLQFAGSFAISGAIAVTFSYALTLAVAIYGVYPTMFGNLSHFAQKSADELGPVKVLWPVLSILAGLVPLVAAILLIASFHPVDLLPTQNNQYQEIAFKGLLIGLIFASACGFEFLRRIGKRVIGLVDVCRSI